MYSMKPSTSTIATGSLRPDSPSRMRASRRTRLEPRSTEKIAAPSVASTIDPSSRPSSVSRPSSQVAASPTTAAVISVPNVASEMLGQSTGRISPQPAARPPSNRIRTSAITPIVRASSTSSKSIQPSPSEPISIPNPRNSTRPGMRRRPATSEAAMPSASSAPARRISVPSATRRVYGRRGGAQGAASAPRSALAPAGKAGEAPQVAPLVVWLDSCPARWRRQRLSVSVDPRRPEAEPARRPDVVLEAERHVEHRLRRLADPRERLPEDHFVGLVGAAVLGRHHTVELEFELAQGVVDDLAIRVRHDLEAEALVAGPPQRRHGV